MKTVNIKNVKNDVIYTKTSCNIIYIKDFLKAKVQ